jgi:RNase H-fold protein (predicted Holliday junction resolvase)
MKISDSPANNILKIIISIDPGSAKTGVAVVGSDKTLLEKKIIPTDHLKIYLKACIKHYKPAIIIMGNGTWSKKIKPDVTEAAEGIELQIVNEKHSTERAKIRYFKENPPRGFWKLLPVTLQVPREPIDDYAAIILAEDYIESVKEK